MNAQSSPAGDLPEEVLSKRYDAFLSYSHAADGSFAPALQRGLKRLARPWRRARALEVFRDTTGLSVNPGLWTSICGALDGSSYFVLLASPGAAASEWVGRELERWLAGNEPGSILVVLTDGRWAWDEHLADFDWAQSTSVPPALSGVFSHEPSLVDMSWARDADSLTLLNARFRNQVAELAAPLHGVTPEQLLEKDVEQRKRAGRLARVAFATLAVLTFAAVTAGVVAVLNQQRAADERDRAEVNRVEAEVRSLEATSIGLAALSMERTLGSGDLGLLLAARADRFATTDSSTSALESLVATDVTRYLHGASGGLVDIEISPDGSRVAAADGTGTLLVWDASTGSLAFDPVTGDAGNVAWSGDGTILMAAGRGEDVRFYDELGDLDGQVLHTGHMASAGASPEAAPLGHGCWSAREPADVLPSTCTLEVHADLDPTGELLMIYQPGDDRLDVWDREAGEVMWSASRTGGQERFDDRSGHLLLPSAAVDPRSGTSTPRPIAEDTQLCAEVNLYSGPQAYDAAVGQWAVVDSPSRQIALLDYAPSQGSPEYPNLRCYPSTGDVAAGWARDRLDVLLTSDTRTIDYRRGLIAVGTSQDAVVLIDVNGSAVETADDDLVRRACDIAGRDLDRLEWSIYLPEWPYEPTCPAAVAGDSAEEEGAE